MSSLTAIFGSSANKQDDDSAESEKLLQLYWNRAELKKDFAELRDQKIRLQERLAEQEGDTVRAEQQLEQLETLLLDVAACHSTLVHYQLAALDRDCGQRLATFAELLKRQREERVNSELLQRWEADRRANSAAIEAKIGELRIHAQMLEDRLQAERHRLATMSGLVKLFRGRAATASLDKLAASIATTQTTEQELIRQLEASAHASPPEAAGLDIDAKRMINLMIIAFAVRLGELLSRDQMATHAKHASEVRAGAIDYGTQDECNGVLKQIQSARSRLAAAGDLAGDIKTIAQQIAAHAEYRVATDAVPEIAPAALVSRCEKFERDARPLDVLGEDYWQLSRLLSR